MKQTTLFEYVRHLLHDDYLFFQNSYDTFEIAHKSWPMLKFSRGLPAITMELFSVLSYFAALMTY